MANALISADNSEIDYNSFIDEQGNLDPILIDAVIQQESKGNPYAVSPAGAKGLMQLMDATGEEEFNNLNLEGSYNPFDKDQNKAIGSSYLAKQVKEFGDVRLALTAYNAGPNKVKNIQSAVGKDFEKVQSSLDIPEQKKYATEVLDKYKELKSKATKDSPEKVAKLPVPNVAAVSADVDGYVEATLPIITDPNFEYLSFNDKAKALSNVIGAKEWDQSAYDKYQEQMDVLWQGADPREVPTMQEVAGDPPVVGPNKDPKEVLQNWRTAKTQELLNDGIIVPSFGYQLDKYFDSAIARETTQHARRNKSWLGIVGDLAYTAGTGYLGAFASVEAGAIRIFGSLVDSKGANEFANRLQDNVNFLGKAPEDYLYETDDDGNVKVDDKGQPITKFSAKAASIFGSTAAFLLGGTALYGRGMSVATTLGIDTTVNELSFANDSFRTVYEKTKDPVKAYIAAAYAIPAAGIASLGQIGVVSKLAHPSIEGLSGYYKATYIADIMARQAALASTTMAGADLVQQLGETSQTGEEINLDRTTEVAVGAGLAGGVIGGIQGARTRRTPTETPPSAQLALPAPQTNNRLALPPGTTRAALPGREERLGLPSPVVLGPDTNAVRLPVDPQEAIKVTKKVSDFVNSKAAALELTRDEALQLPNDMLSATDTVIVPREGGGYTVSRQANYTAITPDEIGTLKANIDNLKEELQNSPPPEKILEANQKRREIDNKIKELERSTGPIAVAIYKAREPIFDRYNKAASAYESDKSGAVYQEYKQAMADLEAFDIANAKVFSPDSELAALYAEKKELERISSLPISVEHYANNLTLKDAHLAEMQAKYDLMQADMEAKGEIPSTAFDPSKGILVDGHVIVPEQGKWYAVDADNNFVGGAHDFYYDALAAIENKNRPDTTQFLLRKENNGRLSDAQVKAIEGKIRADVDARAKNEELSQKARDIFYKDELKKALKRAEKEAKAQGKTTEEGLSKGKKGTIYAEENPILKEATGKTKPEFVDERTGEPLSESSTESLKADPYFTQYRRRIRKPLKPLTSNYTNLKKFARDSTVVVRSKDIFDSAVKLAKSLDKDIKAVVGGLMPEQTVAFYQQNRHLFKFGRWGDPQQLIHELMHLVDAKLIGKWLGNGKADYSSMSAQTQEALKDQARTFYPFRKPPSEILLMKEGLTMFFQNYASGQPYRKDILPWYRGEFARANPEVYKSLENLKTMVEGYYNQSPLTHGKSRTVEETKFSRAVDAVKQYWSSNKLYDQWSRTSNFFKEVQSKYEQGKTPDELKGKPDVYTLYRSIINKAEPTLKFIVNKARVNKAGQIVEGAPLYDILENYSAAIKADLTDKITGKGPTEKEVRSDMFQYLSKWTDRADLKRGIDPGVSEEDIIGTIRELDRKSPLFSEMKNEYSNFLNYFDDLRASIDPQSAKIVELQRKANLKAGLPEHGDWFPRQRAGKGKGNSNKGRTGGTGNVVDSFANIESALAQRLNQAYLSELKFNLAKIASDPSSSFEAGLVREIQDADGRIGMLKQLKAEAEAPGPDGSIPLPIKDDADLLQYAYGADVMNSVNGPNFNVFTYYDGKNLRFFETDPRFAIAIERKMPAYANSLLYKLGIRAPMSAFKLAATSLNTAFQLKNMIFRDPPKAMTYILSNPDMGWKDATAFLGDYVQALVDVPVYATGTQDFFKRLGYKNVGDYSQLMDRLGVFNSAQVAAEKQLRTRLEGHYGTDKVINYLDVVADRINTALNFGELATRQAVLRTMGRKRGILPENNLTVEQAHAARVMVLEATNNYADAGLYARNVGHFIPFFGARMVDLNKTYEDFRRNPLRIGGYYALLATAGYAYALANKDDRAYKELPTQVKMGSFTFPVTIDGVEKIAYLPMDSGSMAAWGTGQAFGIKASEDPTLPVTYSEIAKSYWNLFSPVTSPESVLGPLGSTIAQVYFNKNSYTDRPVVPLAVATKKKQEQYNQFTTETAKLVGREFNLSPLQVDFVIKNMLPAASQYINFVEQTTGIKDSQESKGINFVTKGFVFSESSNEMNQKSEQLFNDNLITYREGKLTETPQQAEIRKGLERANQTLSHANIVIRSIPDSEVKSKLGLEVRKLLDKANALARGEKIYIPTSPLKQRADAVRKKQQQAEKNIQLRQRGNQDAGFALEGDTSPETDQE